MTWQRLVASAVLVAGVIGLGVVVFDLDSPAEGPLESSAAAQKTSVDEATTTTTDVGERETPAVLGNTTPLIGLDGWLQSEVSSLDDLNGRVHIVHFWTFGCVNCKNTLPHLIELYDDYRADGLEIVGVHSPEFDYERDPDAIAAAAAEHGISWPIALDTRRESFHAWQDAPRFWPRTYVIDAEGQIRYDHIGEGAYDDLRTTVEQLID